MRHRRSQRTLRVLRVSAVARFAALALVVLVLTPFSAPFKTFDLGAQSAPMCAANDKLDSDEILLTSTPSMLALSIASGPTAVVRLDGQSSTIRVSPTPLRL
jgi:hypothetical protein